MRLDTMAATSISGAAAAALAITAYMALMGGNGLAYVILFGLFQAQVAAACTVADEEPGGILGEEVVPHGNTGATVLDRVGNGRRPREAAINKLFSHGPKAFKRRFKVTKRTFMRLVKLIRPYVEPDESGKAMAIVSSGSYIPAELQLAVTLRWLAGANHLCQEDNYDVGGASVYHCLWQVIYALDTVIPAPKFDPTDENAMESLATSMFVRSKQSMAGCVGAIDGMAVKIRRPTLRDCPNPFLYRNRKQFYSINLQAMCDGNRKFLWWSMLTVGSTHDSLAFAMSKLGQRLEEVGLPEGYWIAGDDAYVSNEYMLTPFSTKASKRDRKKDNFNFYQSRCRINIECAFGILVEKFGVLRRELSTSLEHTTTVVSVCMKLHNLTIDDNIQRIKPLARDIKDHDNMKPVKQDMVSYAPRDYKKRVKSDKRDILTETLATIGLVRPVNHRTKKQRTI